jgi:receptor protein-tyrosine kinase
VQPPNPAELLARPDFAQLLKTQWAAEFDVLIIDTPAMADSADAQTVAMCAGAAMIVARKNASRYQHVKAIAEQTAQTGATIVGTVLNDY